MEVGRQEQRMTPKEPDQLACSDALTDEVVSGLGATLGSRSGTFHKTSEVMAGYAGPGRRPSPRNHQHVRTFRQASLWGFMGSPEVAC